MTIPPSRVFVSGTTPHAHEEQAVHHLLSVLPDRDPYQVGYLFDLVDTAGRRYEVDALVLGYDKLYLIEIKHWGGRITGDHVDWVIDEPGRKPRFEQNPLSGANRKAKILGSMLDRALGGGPRPFVEALIFLSNPQVQIGLKPPHSNFVVTCDTLADALVQGRYLGASERERGRIDTPAVKRLRQAFSALGLRSSQSSRKIGQFTLKKIIEEGLGYQDYEATHDAMPGEFRRVRHYLVPASSTPERKDALERAARREALTLRVLEHPHILRFHDYIASGDISPALVFAHDERWLRLDDLVRREGAALRLDHRLAIIHQLAEAVSYCHAKSVIHRALHPGAVLVRFDTDATKIDVKLYNMQMSVREGTDGTQHLSLLSSDDALLYRAPEVIENAQSARKESDIFSLGSIAYWLLTDQPPATSLAERAARLERDGALIAAAVRDDLAGAKTKRLDSHVHPGGAVAYATDRLWSNRPDDALEWVYLLLDELTAPDAPVEYADPLDARPGDRLGDTLVVERVLGSGSSAKVFRVKRGSEAFALKIALDEDQHPRLAAEAETLRRLRSPHIVSLEDELELNGRKCLLLSDAGDSLSDVLHREGPQSLDYARRFGEQLLAALEVLEAKGETHRDIKPANLGVVSPSKQARQLVLFDFSLARVPAAQIDIGTPAYRDPFLQQRGAWDIAADLYAAALVLYEMLTATRLRWQTPDGFALSGDGPPAIEADRFDASVRQTLMAFFEKSLARDFQARFPSAEDMRNAWLRCFLGAQEADEAPLVPLSDEAIAQLSDATPVASLSLSARARNALDRAGALSIAEVLRLPENQLSAIRGVGRGTSQEILEFVQRLKARPSKGHAASAEAAFFAPFFAPSLKHAVTTADLPGVPKDILAALDYAGIARATDVAAASQSRLERIVGKTALPLLTAALESLAKGNDDDAPGNLLSWVEAFVGERDEAALTKSGKPKKRTGSADLGHVRAMLGLDPAANDHAAFPDSNSVATLRGVTRQAIHLALSRQREVWRDKRFWPRLEELVLEALDGHGGLARGEDVADTLALFVDSSLRTGPEREAQRRNGRALVRLAVEASTNLASARIHGRLFVARQGETLDTLRYLGVRGDYWGQREPLASHSELEKALRGAVKDSPLESSRLERLVELAAMASEHVAMSPRLELYPRNMAPERALRLCASAIGGKKHTPAEIRQIVYARYPDAAALPDGPAFAALLASVGLQVKGENETSREVSSTVLSSAVRTLKPTHNRTADPIEQENNEFLSRVRLAVEQSAFRAVPVPAAYMTSIAAKFAERLGTAPMSLDALLVNALEEERKANDVDEAVLFAADREGSSGGAWLNVRTLAKAAAARVLTQLAERAGPLVLTEPGLLARYDLSEFLTQLRALTDADAGPSVFLLVPCHDQLQAPPIDGVPHSLAVPVVTPNEWLALPPAWMKGPLAS